MPTDIALKRWRRNGGAALAAALALLAAPGTATAQASGTGRAAAVAAPPAMVRYVVRPGDNLFRLAADYLIRPDTYRTVQRINRVADPLRLPIGMVLEIPRELLRHKAVQGTVLSYRGAVTIGGKSAALGMTVTEGALIETGQKSFVTLTLPDATTVALPSQSAVRVQRLRRVVLDDHVERLFAIERGRASATVTPMTDPHSSFQFSAPGAITSVRGTSFRMGYDAEAGRATSEVLEGKVGFDAGAQGTQALPAGYGTASDLPAPVELLPPPALIDAERVQSAQGVAFALRPEPGARAWHVQIGRDAAFLEIVDETFVSAPEAHFAALPDGAWFVRATAIDGNGLEGEPAVAAFRRQLAVMRMAVEMGWAGPLRQYLFRWDDPAAGNVRYRFQLARDGKEDRPIVDLPGLADQAQAVIDLPRGRYRWRVMTSRLVDGRPVDEWSAYGELRVEDRW